MTERQYKAFCDNAENMRVYDGRGETDIYYCYKCGKIKTSVYRDKGVTPFTVRCECGHYMAHRHTESGVVDNPDMEWVRPTYAQYMELTDGAREHVENGGLVLKSELKD